VRPSDTEEGASATGLYTGAIAQDDAESKNVSFADLGLSEPILRTVESLGFQHPTPIQAGVIPAALAGQDIIGLAETGSGKTAAFCLPLVERLTHSEGIRAVIVCPTREIALQTKAFLDIFCRAHSLQTVCVIGGVRMNPQITALRRKPDIIVATPGRLLDHIERRNVRLNQVQELVLDEADHMLDLGFLPQINGILRQIPEQRQTLLFSATMPPAIERLASRLTDDPIRVDIRPDGQAAAGIEHRLYLVNEKDMKKCLLALLGEVEGSTLIFARRRLHTEWLARFLHSEDIRAERIHSDRTQAHRVRALREFREGKQRILVATDVAARGLDIPAIQHVINFGPPETPEDYIHRAGRTARGSAQGTVSTIARWLDKGMIKEIELTLGKGLPRCEALGVEPYREIKRRKVIRRRLL
jgi:ATP-dependent RNA helicase RhlE